MKAVAIYCVDGRLEGSRKRVRELIGGMGYDVSEGGLYGLTKAGPDAACSGKRGDLNCQSVYSDIDLLLDRGVEPATIVLVSHSNCAGHPVEDHEHHDDTKVAGKMLHEKYNRPVICLFDERISDGEWKLSHVCTFE